MHYNFITNHHLLWKAECKWQKDLLSFDDGMNDLVDIHASTGHRRCFKSKLKRIVLQLNQNLRMEELIEYLEHDWDKSDKTKDDLEKDKKLMNFMKDQFDKLIFKADRDYHLVFSHLNMGDTTLAKKAKITKTTAKNSYQKLEMVSLIDNIDSTYQCGICGSRNDPINCNFDKESELVWIECDGPREDDSDSIFCNQWHHQDCINVDYYCKILIRLILIQFNSARNNLAVLQVCCSLIVNFEFKLC